MNKNDNAGDRQQDHKRLPDYSQDGVDLTLIRWMLSLTPSERLLVLQENIQSILRLRREHTVR